MGSRVSRPIDTPQTFSIAKIALPLLRFGPSVDPTHHETQAAIMKRHLDHHDSSAPRGGACLAAWLDSGITAGLVVVDANRPAAIAASVRLLPSRLVGAPH